MHPDATQVDAPESIFAGRFCPRSPSWVPVSTELNPLVSDAVPFGRVCSRSVVSTISLWLSRPSSTRVAAHRTGVGVRTDVWPQGRTEIIWVEARYLAIGSTTRIRQVGIEPTSRRWQRRMIPLHYWRSIGDPRVERGFDRSKRPVLPFHQSPSLEGLDSNQR